MLNEKRIRIMMDLSRYENQKGQEEIKISRYYRSDYLGFALFKNFFLVTLGYAVVLGIIVMYHMEFLMSNIYKMNIIYLAGAAICGYLALLAVYSIVAYARYSMKYRAARRGVHLYDRKLAELLELYGKEESKKNSMKNERQ